MDIAPILPLVFRGIERLMIILFGGLCIYWGYRLFYRSFDADAELIAERGDAKLTLKRVGPGVLFALFGVVVLTAGVVQSLWMGGTQGPRKEGDNNSDFGEIRWGQAGVASDVRKERAVAMLYAIKTTLHYHDAGPPKDETQKKQLGDAMESLRAYLPILIDLIHEDGTFDRYQRWKEIRRVVPSFIDTLPPNEQKLFKSVESYFQEIIK